MLDVYKRQTLLRIIVGELPADSGIVTLKKEASFGYLAQNQNVNSENTIYEELLSVKAPVIAMEKQLREMEEKMHTVNGSELDSLMENYARLNHQFELENEMCIRDRSSSSEKSSAPASSASIISSSASLSHSSLSMMI